jgi:hypothetical protein
LLQGQRGEIKAKIELEKPQKCETKPLDCRKQRPEKTLSHPSHIRLV